MSTRPLQYAPWSSDIELGFYSSLANIKINHDRLDSSARKVLGLYAIDYRDSPERSMRMEIHGNALTADDLPAGYYRAEGTIRNFNTIDEFRQVDKSTHVERAGRIIWDAINDGTIYSCPSLLASFSAISFADLKKYKFTYHFAYPCVHSDPQWKLVVPDDTSAEQGVTKLGSKETEMLVDAVQTWRYSVDARQYGFFLAKRMRREILEAQWRAGEIEADHDEDEEEENDELGPTAQQRRKSRSQSLSELGYVWMIAPLSSFETGFFRQSQPEDRFVCFADPSTYPSNPGWMLRNLLVVVRQRWKLDDVQILAYRDVHSRRELATSLVFQLQSAEPVFERTTNIPIMITSSALRPGDVDAFGELIETQVQSAEPKQESRSSSKAALPLPKITGWERNEHNKLLSRVVDLAAYMDPAKLADQAVDLNLKLIKWRISPSIDLEAIKHTSCLLLGAGTLGSYVARALMGWGVRKITFVDNARVSYSNPVRQPLFNFHDCENGGARKAERAAKVLSEIYPGIDAEGHVMSVPMAGHALVDEARTQAEFEKLKDLIERHDAMFLLMDTRESRWLPTVMGKAAGKIVINAALGFDTFVVMRHGLSKDPSLPAAETLQSDNSHSPQRSSGPAELGCYFCSDVVAPADSLKSATLDQQCTVTRPGAAPLASALAVELLVSITQHRLKGHAPAPDPQVAGSANQIQSAPPTDASLPDSHPLGTVPHQLRGYMSTWQTIQVRGQAYDCCAACSPKIVQAYRDEGWSFVKKALAEKGYVELVSGLAEVQRRAEELDLEIDEWDDDDDVGQNDDEPELI